MELKNCFTCGKPLRYVKAGVSQKTGKSYDAFWACENKCKVRTPPEIERIKSETAEVLIFDEIKNFNKLASEILSATKLLNKRFDDLAIFLKKEMIGE